MGGYVMTKKQIRDAAYQQQVADFNARLDKVDAAVHEAHGRITQILCSGAAIHTGREDVLERHVDMIFRIINKKPWYKRVWRWVRKVDA